MSDNEHTTPDIATLASQIINMDDAELVRRAYTNPAMFRSVAASAMTQAADHQAFEARADAFMEALPSVVEAVNTKSKRMSRGKR